MLAAQSLSRLVLQLAGRLRSVLLVDGAVIGLADRVGPSLGCILRGRFGVVVVATPLLSGKHCCGHVLLGFASPTVV